MQRASSRNNQQTTLLHINNCKDYSYQMHSYKTRHPPIKRATLLQMVPVPHYQIQSSWVPVGVLYVIIYISIYVYIYNNIYIYILKGMLSMDKCFLVVCPCLIGETLVLIDGLNRWIYIYMYKYM